MAKWEDTAGEPTVGNPLVQMMTAQGTFQRLR